MSSLNERFLGLAGVVPLKPMLHGSNPDLINFTNVDLIKEITENKLDSDEVNKFLKKKDFKNPFNLKLRSKYKNGDRLDNDPNNNNYDELSDSNVFEFDIIYNGKKVGDIDFFDYFGNDVTTINRKIFSLDNLAKAKVDESLVDRIYRAFFFTKKGELLFNKLMNLNENKEVIQELMKTTLDSNEDSKFLKKSDPKNPFDLKFVYRTKKKNPNDEDYADIVTKKNGYDEYKSPEIFRFDFLFNNKKIGFVKYNEKYENIDVAIGNRIFSLKHLTKNHQFLEKDSLVDKIYYALYFTKKGKLLFNELMNLNENVEGSDLQSQFIDEIDFYRTKFSNNKQWIFSRLNNPRIGFSLTNYNTESGFNDIITVELVNNKISVKYKDNLDKDVKLDDIRKFIQDKTGKFLSL